MGWFTKYIANPLQDLVGWQGDTARVDRAKGDLLPKSAPPPSKGGSQDQDNSQVTKLESGGDQAAETGDTDVSPKSSISQGSTGGGVASGGAGYGSTVSNIEETTSVSNQNTVSPVTEVEVSNQSQSNSQGSQALSVQSQAQKANTYNGGSTTVAPVITFDLGDEQTSSTWQLALLCGAALAGVYLFTQDGKGGETDGNKV